MFNLSRKKDSFTVDIQGHNYRQALESYTEGSIVIHSHETKVIIDSINSCSFEMVKDGAKLIGSLLLALESNDTPQIKLLSALIEAYRDNVGFSSKCIYDVAFVYYMSRCPYEAIENRIIQRIFPRSIKNIDGVSLGTMVTSFLDEKLEQSLLQSMEVKGELLNQSQLDHINRITQLFEFTNESLNANPLNDLTTLRASITDELPLLKEIGTLCKHHLQFYRFVSSFKSCVQDYDRQINIALERYVIPFLDGNVGEFIDTIIFQRQRSFQTDEDLDDTGLCIIMAVYGRILSRQFMDRSKSVSEIIGPYVEEVGQYKHSERPMFMNRVIKRIDLQNEFMDPSNEVRLQMKRFHAAFARLFYLVQSRLVERILTADAVVLVSSIDQNLLNDINVVYDIYLMMTTISNIIDKGILPMFNFSKDIIEDKRNSIKPEWETRLPIGEWFNPAQMESFLKKFQKSLSHL